MCLPIGSCFGPPPTDDHHYHAPANKHGAPPPSRGQQHHPQRNGGGGHYTHDDKYHHAPANKHGAPPSRGQHQPQRNGGGGGGGHYNVNGNGYYTGAQQKDDGTLKQQQVAADGARDGEPRNYYSYHAAADSHYPAATTATADHGRY